MELTVPLLKFYLVFDPWGIRRETLSNTANYEGYFEKNAGIPWRLKNICVWVFCEAAFSITRFNSCANNVQNEHWEKFPLNCLYYSFLIAGAILYLCN